MAHSFSLLQLCDILNLDNIVLLQQEAGALGLAKLSVFTSDSVVKGSYTTCSHFFKLLVIYKTSEEITESLFPSKGTILSAEVLLIKLKK